MQERRWRPKFWNPFADNKSSVKAVFRGFFRQMPLHRWSPAAVTKVLEYAAARPKYFGFGAHPVCIVNPLLLTKNFRSRQQGVTVFGTDRGCKTIIIPPSCTGAPFDEVDSRLVEPLFKRNPSVEHVYLSRDCIPMANQLVPMLSQLRHVKHLVLPGWNDAIAIHKIVMACKQCEVVDAMAIETDPIDWANEASIQALCTLIEMHPKLRAVLGNQFFLTKWFTATNFSRCKYNVALLTDSCEATSVIWSICYTTVFFAIYYFVNYGTRWLPNGEATPTTRVFSVVLLIVLFCSGDHYRRRELGRLWTHIVKYVVLGLRRVAVIRSK